MFHWRAKASAFSSEREPMAQRARADGIGITIEHIIQGNGCLLGYPSCAYNSYVHIFRVMS